MAETRVQVAAHFTIDPAKQVIGLIEFPETVTVTILVGDHIEPKKVPFAEAFTPEQKTLFEEKLSVLVKEVLRTAQPVTATPQARGETASPQEGSSPEISEGAFDVL